MHDRDLPLWRSLLFVPILNERYIDRAHTRGADAVILDLEDSIALSSKPAARAAVRPVARALREKGVDVLVRINSTDEMMEADLKAAVSPWVTAIDVPKADPERLERIDSIVAGLERTEGLAVGSIRLKLIVETASAMLRLREISDHAHRNPRIVAITLGNEDLCTELGAEPTPDVLLGYCQQIVVAARAAGILPLGYADSVADYADLDRFRRSIGTARQIGFTGSSCVHPAHVPILNEMFSPSPAEVAEATEVITAARNAADEGAFEFRGRMVDRPIVTRAERILELDRRVRQTAAHRTAGPDKRN